MEPVSEVGVSQSAGRLGNVITVLIPAKTYSIACAWTVEKPLPAIEIFACRLLLIFERLLPGEMQGYFGLDDRETEVLIEDLLRHKLVTFDAEGSLEPSPLLRSQSVGPDGLPMLVKYEEKAEQTTFELLTMSVRARGKHARTAYGLEEIAMPEERRKLSSDEVAEAFRKQYRAHLELSRRTEQERRRTRLYKIMGCDSVRTHQIAVDVHFSYEASNSPVPFKTVRSIERSGAALQLPLSYELESAIADYLGTHVVEPGGLTFENYCDLVQDDTLKPYCSSSGFNYSGWLHARSERKTGYGSPETTGVFGAIYLPKNRDTITHWLKAAVKSAEGGYERRALWYGSNVPLWGCNSDDLSEFVRTVEEVLSTGGGESGRLTVVHPGSDKGDLIRAKSRFSSRIRNGVMVTGDVPFDRVEFFIVPGLLAVTQYHGLPDSDSCVTAPLGYLTVDKERIQRLELVVRRRLAGREKIEVSWSAATANVDELVPSDLLNGSVVSDGLVKSSGRKVVVTVKGQGRRRANIADA